MHRTLDRLIRLIQGFGAGPDGGVPQVLVVCPPPILETGCLAEMFAGGEAKSHQLAPALKTMAARRGVLFLDAGAHIAVSAVDGIHYEAADQVKLGMALAKAVGEIFGG